MMRHWKSHLLLTVAALLLVPSSALSAVPGNNFPFVRVELRTPPQENPFPGIGNYYSALALGIDTVMWNPASLTRVGHAQSSISLLSGLKNYASTKTYKTDDGEQNIGDNENFKIGYYLTGDESVTQPATREHTGHVSYKTEPTGVKFKQALKLNEWFTFGILTQNETGFSMDMSGAFPVTTKIVANFYDSADFMGPDLSIDNQGYLTFIHTQEGGSTYTSKTSEKLWSGFLNQSSTVPISLITESRNDISIDPKPTLCGAGKWNNLSFGASLTQIDASANVNNISRGIIKDGTSDINFYQPDFDPNIEQDSLNWIQDPNRYGTELGYKRNVISVPAGEVVAEARYQGFYQASATRMDLGATYDVGNDVSFGLVLENFTGASLNFRGSGRVAYANSRISTAEPPAFDPSAGFNWNPFTDTFEPAEGSEKMFLEENINVELPRKIRLGAVFRKPFLVALDYEQNSSPFVFKYSKDSQDMTTTIKTLRILRFGWESQLLVLPMYFKFGIPFLLKPDLESTDPDLINNLEKAFQFGIVPAGLDLGTEFNIFGYRVGTDLGFNISSILSLYQLDGLNLDLGKVGYYDISVKQDPWNFTYLAAIDPGSTAGAYSEREDKSKSDFNVGYLKWIQTFTVSYKF